MNHPKNFHNLWFVINELGYTILKKLEDYKEQIEKNSVIVRAFYNIEFVYIHSIVLDIAKLISATGSDKSGLKQLKKICPDKRLKARIIKFEQTYNNTLVKIMANRNKIIAHVDISDMGSYMHMGFSKVEIEKKIADYSKNTCRDSKAITTNFISDIKKLESVSVDKERYSPSDFSLEISTLEGMVKEVVKIADEINLYFYKLNSRS